MKHVSAVDLREQVEKVLEKVRPAIQMDGGDIEFVDVNQEQGVVRIRFRGACVGCPLSTLTLQAGIAREIKKHIPSIRDVEAVP